MSARTDPRGGRWATGVPTATAATATRNPPTLTRCVQHGKPLSSPRSRKQKRLLQRAIQCGISWPQRGASGLLNGILYLFWACPRTAETFPNEAETFEGPNDESNDGERFVHARLAGGYDVLECVNRCAGKVSAGKTSRRVGHY